jgi:hypothetical protein
VSEEQIRRIVRNFPENGMKTLLQRAGNVREMLTLAGCELTPRLVFDEMAVDPTTYVSADYSHVSSDIVLTVPVRAAKGRRKRPLSLTILIEHQSDPDRLMLLRVLDYLVQIWRHQVRAWEQEQGSRASVKLRPVLPVVFYTGSYRWERLGRLTDLMDEGEAVARHTPTFEPIFVNLPELSEEWLSRGGYFGHILRLLQQRRAKRTIFRSLVEQVTAALETMPADDRPRRQELLSYLAGAVYHYRAASEREEMLTAIQNAAKVDEFRLEVNMVRRTIADAERDEGRIEIQRKTLITLLRQRFGELPTSLERSIQATANIDQLQTWLERVIPAESIADMGIPEKE